MLQWPARAVPAGSAVAVFCAGACWDSESPLVELRIIVAGECHPAGAFAMPRPDLAASGAPRRSGFWAIVPVRAGSGPEPIPVHLEARLANGALTRCLAGHLDVAALDPAPLLSAEPADPGPGLIAVCMATYEPDMDLFRVQVESLRAQSDRRWVCVISDDCSSPESFEHVTATVAGDSRFALSRSETRLGFYRNFERALSMAPPAAELVALSDQDDRWHPDKLAVLRERIGEALLVYSDQRLVEASGRVRRTTMWQGRGNNHDNLASMVIANTITGGASMFRRRLLDLALPFPDAPGFQFHDHWLAVIAVAADTVAYVDRPLYDYVQHPGAVFGDVTHGRGGRRRESRMASIRARLSPASWRAAYFYGYAGRAVQARTALLRCSEVLTEEKRRALEWFLACDHSTLAAGWLVARTTRRLAGRTETLGTELELARGVAWKRCATAAPRLVRDAGLPPLSRFSEQRLRRWRASV